ncbi:MAG TPA: hypothetical protein VMV95_02010 [Bacillota bacterium]|nr:hypothetical protein [Bacillota bacterium]
MENTSINREDDTKELNLYGGTAKRPCPFYGFDLVYEMDPSGENSRHILKDQEGSSCALASILKQASFPRCANTMPNWAACPFNNEETKEILGKYLDKLPVFPKDSEVENDASWNGIPLGVWMKHVNGAYNLK